MSQSIGQTDSPEASDCGVRVILPRHPTSAIGAFFDRERHPALVMKEPQRLVSLYLAALLIRSHIHNRYLAYTP
jgi:hypothetical protein